MTSNNPMMQEFHDTNRLFLPGKDRDTQFVGTVSQAAPEQFGFSQSDIRTDIFGLGKTMLYLLTGDTETENISQQGISAGLRKIVIKSTAFDPEQRYKNTEQFIRDLKRYQLRRTAAPNYFMTAACALLFLCIGFAGGFLLKNSSADPSSGLAATTDTTGQAENTDTSTSSQDSLMTQAGVYEFDVIIYKEPMDTLILDFFKYDEDAVIADLEALITMVKNDKGINSVKMKDYADMEISDWDEFWHMDTITRLRTELAYQDGLENELANALADTIGYVNDALNTYEEQLTDKQE